MSSSRQPGIYVRLHRFLRRVLVIGMLLALGLLAGWLMLQNRVGDEIRLEVERRFASHYPGYRVTVREARLIEGRGIEILGLAIFRRPEIEPLVSVDQIMAVCPVCMEDLVRGERPPAEQLRLRGLKLRARQDETGNWDIARLWPPPKFGPHTPQLIVRDASVQVVSGQDQATRTFDLRNLQLDMVPEIAQAVATQAGREGSGGQMRARGSAAGDHFESLRFEALLPIHGGPWSVRGHMSALQLSPQLYEVVPSPWREKCSDLASISGRVSLHFQVTGNSLKNEPPRFTVTGALTDGQIVDRRLPYRLYDAQGEFYWDDQKLEIKEFFARNRACELELSLTRHGFADSSPLSLVARAHRLTLDSRFVEVLPKSHQGLWRQYFPMGVIDADVRLEFDGKQWHPEVQVECHDVSFVYHKFPYRLERAHGNISLKQDQLSLALEAAAGSQNVSINGLVRQPGENAIGWLEIACERPIPLDEKLLDAVIDPKAKEVIRSLHPGGTLAMVGRFERLQPGGEIHRFVRIDLHNCTMQYDRFPYPLGMIRGTIVWDDQGWTFQKLSGRNDSGYIECEGAWTPTDDSGSLLTLKFVGTDVPLEDELREALNPGAQRVWHDLHPRGSVDRLDVTLSYRSARNDLSLEVRGQNWKKRPGDEGRSITITPSWFPYRLDDVTGVLVYRDGDVFLQGLSARHDDTTVSLDGRCRFEPDGPWAAEVSNLVVDRMRFDGEVVNALPEDLGRAIGRLSPRGNLSMRGSLNFRGVAGGIQPTGTGWDVTVDVENGSLNCGLHLENIHGDVRLVGNGLGQDFHSRGELNVDSLVYQDLQLTQIRGPLLIQRDRVVLGAEAERDRTDAPPRSLAAQVIGGTLSSDIVVYLEGDVPFRLRAALERGDLQQFAREISPNNQRIRGKANALVNLAGTAQGRHTWRGDGFVRLYEADIYEIPVMLALLKVLSIRRPDRTAFTSSDIDFRIQGEHLYFDRINFNGDAVSLKGHGEMSLDRQINMEFYTLVGRREWDPPALRAFLQQAAQQILLIRATGTLDQPHLTREALPMVRETLDQLFPEVAARNQNARLAPGGLP